jgi:hypothetical protein
MPLYDAAGNPLGPVPVIGAKHLTSYPPLTNAELATIVTQLEQGLAHGVPESVPVTMPTGILVRLVRRAMLSELEETPSEPPPFPEMPWMNRVPEGRELTLTPEQIEAAQPEATVAE